MISVSTYRNVYLQLIIFDLTDLCVCVCVCVCILFAVMTRSTVIFNSDSIATEACFIVIDR